MVLRTVYLPSGLDEELKKLAFHQSTSKGALIRKALTRLVEGEISQADAEAAVSIKPDSAQGVATKR